MDGEGDRHARPGHPAQQGHEPVEPLGPVQVLHPVHGGHHRPRPGRHLGHRVAQGLQAGVARRGHRPVGQAHGRQVGHRRPVGGQAHRGPTHDQHPNGLLGERMPEAARPQAGLQVGHRQAGPPGQHGGQQGRRGVAVHQADAGSVVEHPATEPTARRQQADQPAGPPDGGGQGVGVACAPQPDVRLADAELAAQPGQVGAVLARLHQPVLHPPALHLAQHRGHLDGLGLGPPDDVDHRGADRRPRTVRHR